MSIRPYARNTHDLRYVYSYIAKRFPEHSEAVIDEAFRTAFEDIAPSRAKHVITRHVRKILENTEPTTFKANAR